eukprot:GCRY01003177.1.p1 GENE.GCRY01003177.1~~GCRY01003177.1.p1  ORF type:complete len:345 (-),score=44.39 GCRY01003177.1:63-1097(-)
MEPSSILQKLKNFDVYPKTKEEVEVKTLSGAVVSFVSIFLMLLLFRGELNDYLTTNIDYDVFVDTHRDEQLKINIDLVVNTQCEYVDADLMDVTGEVRRDVDATVKKQPTDYHYAKYIADPTTENREKVDPFFLKNFLKNTQHRGLFSPLPVMSNPDGKSCHIFGSLDVKKVAGNFHFAAGRNVNHGGGHFHDLKGVDEQNLNFTHQFNRLSFGENFPGIVNPLDGVERVTEAPMTMFQYYVKIVPTSYTDSSGNLIQTNQFSATEYKRVIDPAHGAHGLPGIFIKYDITPMMINIHEHTKPLSHFLASCCAIIGGMFTVSGLIDSFIFHLMKKLKMGPATPAS